MEDQASANINSHYFSIIDYVVFGAMLVFSASVGIYFGYYKKVNTRSANRNDTSHKNFGSKKMQEYLLGSRRLKVFPVAMSLVASYISGVTVLGTPSEIYNYGSQYWLIILPIFLMSFIVSYVYLPVFCSLKLGSSYEYLELRFNSAVRTFASVMFVIDELLFLPIIIYVPALAFNQVTGIDLHLIGSIVCVICVFYTLVGGIKAVVHTDAWQIIIMFLSVVVVVILGTVQLGGFENIFNRAIEGERLNFLNFDPNPYERQTFWSVLIGGLFYWTSFNSVNQTMVQRYMSLPSLKRARQSIAIFTVGIALFVSCCCFAGLLIYAKYHKCDPLTSGLVLADDQLFPIYVMETVGKFKGIPGLFVAGVFGAALSSLSVVLNSTAAVLLQDILRGCLKMKPTEKVAAIFVKSCVFILGAFSLALLFVVEKLGGILGVATSLTAIAAGTSFGVFTLGMLNPYATSKGTIIGAVCGAILSGWVSLGTQVATASGQVVPRKLDVSVDGCIGNFTIHREYPDESGVFPLYRLSFHWITPIGVCTVIFVGTIVSYILGPRDLSKIDPELISPVIHKLLPRSCFTNFGTANKNYKVNHTTESIELDHDLQIS